LAELHSRFTFTCASFVFALLAVPLGIQNRRSGKSGGFAISIVIILVYYILMSVMRTFAERGGAPPGFALWVPNLIFLSVGVILIIMASQEKSVSIVSLRRMLQDCFRRVT
jgi:lipopolysaccharide export system permease protein